MIYTRPLDFYIEALIRHLKITIYSVVSKTYQLDIKACQIDNFPAFYNGVNSFYSQWSHFIHAHNGVYIYDLRKSKPY
ncbi:Hypothetical predicted protein [Octopus vulgaris]|uniref:Uncharacterized protein n=1 Tax=Octopus vulgaris TaxID=6645 RepID=A0AA36F0N5_OCTVU|nr:Hypothetical predicted protein [Octopus vulgaris]